MILVCGGFVFLALFFWLSSACAQHHANFKLAHSATSLAHHSFSTNGNARRNATDSFGPCRQDKFPDGIDTNIQITN